MRGVFTAAAWGLVLTAFLAAEKMPVSLRGDTLIYQGDSLFASGNARLVYDEREVLADTILIDTRTNRVEVTGLRAPLLPETSAQKIFINFYEGGSVLTDQRWQGRQAGLTTCDLLEPHYRLAAREFLYYPDDKVVAYHLTAHFWFSPVPLFYTPYYAFYTGPRRVVFTFPKIGSNTVEGNFIKTETLYFLDAHNEGGVLWDAMSLKGNGSGWWHRYDYGQPGFFYLYHVPEREQRPLRESVVLRWQQKLSFAEQQLELDHRYRKMYLLPQGYDDTLADTLRYSYRQDKDWLQTEYSFREDYQAERESQHLQSNSTIGAQTNQTVWQKDFRRADGYRYEALNIDERYQLSDEWQYRINPVYYRVKTTQDEFYEQRLDLAHTLELSPQEKKYFEKMTVEANYYYDLDQGTVTTDTLSAEWLEKTPQITVKAVRQNIGGADEDAAWFSLDSSYSSGWIRESKYFGYVNGRERRRFFETAKYTADYAWHKTFRLPGAQLTLLESYAQTAYATQDQHYQFSDRPYLLTDWWGFFKNKLEYERTQGEGGSPFFYDDPRQYLTRRGKHTAGLYQSSRWELTATLAKDFENNLYDDDLYNLRVDPWENGRALFNLATGQSRYTALYRDLVGSMQLRYGQSTGRLSFTKDINRNVEDNEYAGKLKTASSELDFYLGEPYTEGSAWNFWLREWHFLIKNTYDFNTAYYNLDTFGLGKDLHCWYMRYHFTPLRKEWYVVFSLKAFPEQEFKLTGNEDNEFNFDAFSDTLSATEVRRYE
ncbi:hypothetical protein NO2_0206 [Candidatus Termititenax persephonae]|uniref:LPS-assembly protein LptD n=1 Tax=Candidatus Termititenax persephonae TaxID=2218525 RepID=A0A388TH00_9BACT|nr:hypothetical protein NO2_0206 [Candidatus Termititenax persephonae]